jgi:hypothetical protein
MCIIHIQSFTIKLNSYLSNSFFFIIIVVQRDTLWYLHIHSQYIIVKFPPLFFLSFILPPFLEQFQQVSFFYFHIWIQNTSTISTFIHPFLMHTSSHPFLWWVFFWDRVLRTYVPWLALNGDPPDLCLLSTRIAVVSHLHLAWSLLSKSYHLLSRYHRWWLLSALISTESSASNSVMFIIVLCIYWLLNSEMCC